MIQTSSGLCFAVDPLSGDFRENLTPVQLLPCNGTQGQQWDVITAGVHNDVPGTALIVSSLVSITISFGSSASSSDFDRRIDKRVFEF